MKAIRYIGQALRRMATALLTALFGAILWVGALIIGGVLRIILGVFVTLLSIAAFFVFIVWLLTI